MQELTVNEIEMVSGGTLLAPLAPLVALGALLGVAIFTPLAAANGALVGVAASVLTGPLLPLTIIPFAAVGAVSLGGAAALAIGAFGTIATIGAIIL